MASCSGLKVGLDNNTTANTEEAEYPVGACRQAWGLSKGNRKEEILLKWVEGLVIKDKNLWILAVQYKDQNITNPFQLLSVLYGSSHFSLATIQIRYKIFDYCEQEPWFFNLCLNPEAWEDGSLRKDHWLVLCLHYQPQSL